jgi:hypothetical protein
MDSDEKRFQGYLDRIQEAIVNDETDTKLGRVLDRWRGHEFICRRDGQWLFDGFVLYFKMVAEVLSAIDPSIPPDVPPHLLDPAQLAYFFDIPLEEFNWAGATAPCNPILLQKLAGIENKLSQVVDQPPQQPKQAQPLASLEEQRVGTSTQWLTLRQCAALSGRSCTTIRRAIKGGVLKAHNVGRGHSRPTYRVHADDLQRYVEAGQVEPLDPPVVRTTGIRRKSRHFGRPGDTRMSPPEQPCAGPDRPGECTSGSFSGPCVP